MADARGLRRRAPRFSGVAHSGFPEPVQHEAEMRTMELFAAAMGRPFSPLTVARSDKSPFPSPLKVMVWTVNLRTRKTVRAEGLELDERVYGGQSPARR